MGTEFTEKSRSSGSHIGWIVGIIVAVLVSGGVGATAVYFWQQSELGIQKISSSDEIFQTESQIGALTTQISELEESLALAEKNKMYVSDLDLADCRHLEGNWATYSSYSGKTDSLFDNRGFFISFCYNPAWGSPEISASGISDSVKVGEQYTISFADSNLHPLINIYSLDFALTGDRDSNPFCWSCVNSFDMPDEQIIEKSNYPIDEIERVVDSKIFRTYVTDTMLLTGEKESQIHYYLPKTLRSNSFNIEIIASTETDNDVRTMAQSIVY